MKRESNLFEKIITIDNLELAYNKAKKSKTWQNTVKNFEDNKDKNLKQLQQDLKNEKFTTSNYKIKTIYEPKQRDIYILPFYPDRIAQHAIMNIVEPIWDRRFIYDSYACRKGKGQHKGSKRCMQFIRKYNYCLQCDISKFYPSINHNRMFELVENTIKCKQTLNLLKNIIYSLDGGKNIPIGNYTSQWLGNLYMHVIDIYCKHKLKIKGYIRYCDDFILFSNDKTYLKECLKKIEYKLNNELFLHFSKKSIFPITQGIDFLGYRHFRTYILLRKSTIKRVVKRLNRLPLLLEKGIISKEQYISSIQSTKGWLKWSNSYNFSIYNKIDEMLIK